MRPPDITLNEWREEQADARVPVGAFIEAAGASLLHLPPDSPDFNPIGTPSPR